MDNTVFDICLNIRHKTCPIFDTIGYNSGALLFTQPNSRSSNQTKSLSPVTQNSPYSASHSVIR
ncbi:hypothetical protein BTV99_10050 [Psychrobacter sp. Rd 27.2]|nr:hypothetical protein BTV99_10050 [Psychrobacter sp. Rd 27.2]